MAGEYQLLGPNGAPLPKGIGRAVRELSATSSAEMARNPGSGQLGGGGRQEMAGWNPSQTSADGAFSWARDDLVAKTRDLLANEPWAQGAVDRKLDMVVGAGWRPSIKPDAEALGITPEDAATLGKAIERAWRGWADDPLCRCDQEQTLNANWLLSVAALEHEVCGDGLGVLRWKPNRGWPYRTSLQLVDADRLSNPNEALDTPQLKGGISFDADGAPSTYHIRNAHPGDWGRVNSAEVRTWTPVPRRHASGRPGVLHIFRKDRPGQTRGVSRLVNGLGRFKQIARYGQAELANVVLNSLFAATITSSFDPAVVQQDLTTSAMAGYADLRNTFYDTTTPTLDGTRIQHLFPGDELKFLTDSRSSAAFEQFSTVFLRSIASSLGIAYEQIAMDWSKVNYSSARAALIEVWRGIMKTRSLIAMMWATPLLLAVTEDAIDAGLIDVPAAAPGLYENAAAWLRGRWIGPARGWVDPVKEPMGALLQVEGGFNNWEDVAADQGIDFDLNLDALASQRDAWLSRGMVPPALATMLAAAQAATDPHAEPAAASA